MKKIVTMKSSSLLNWEYFKSRHEAIEKSIENRPGAYQGIRPEALYTSHEDLKQIFSHELIQGTFLDLGCGSGETCLYYGSLFPERQSIGIEFQTERLKVGEEFKIANSLHHVSLIQGDLLKIEIPEADTYFLYFPTGPVLDRVLTTLYAGQKPFRLVAIESHGDLFSRLELENWLSLQAEIPLSSQRHHPMARIFEREFLIRDPSLLPFTVSFENRYLLIEDQKEVWVGETIGLEWTNDDRFELMTPPRTIFWKSVKKMMLFSDFGPEAQLLLKLRSQGKVIIMTRTKKLQGFIRKITINPSFGLEISSGEKVEWSEILTIFQESILCYESSQDS